MSCWPRLRYGHPVDHEVSVVGLLRFGAGPADQIASSSLPSGLSIPPSRLMTSNHRSSRVHTRFLRSSAILVTTLGLVGPLNQFGAVVGPPAVGVSRGQVRLASSALPSQHDDGSLREQYDEVLGEEAALINRVQRVQAERARLNGELEKLQADLQAKNVELLGAQAELDEAEFLGTIYAQAVVDARQKEEVAEERLRKQIVATYVNGGADASVLEALLKATSGEEFGQALAFSKAVVGDTEILVKNLQRAREEAREADRVAKANTAKAEARRDEVDAARRFISAARDNQVRLVDEINIQLMLESQALMEVQGRRALVEGRINAMTTSSDGVAMLLADRQRNQPDWQPGRYPITNPLPGYRIGSAFGMRFHPILNIERLHAGGDMGAPSGTPIHAAAEGIVVVASERGGYGLAVVIDHGDSLATLYAHQSAIAVRPGQEVKRGDVIGWVGSTGLSTGPHLHLEVRVKGMPVNPDGIVDFEAEVDYGRN